MKRTSHRFYHTPNTLSCTSNDAPTRLLNSAPKTFQIPRTTQTNHKHKTAKHPPPYPYLMPPLFFYLHSTKNPHIIFTSKHSNSLTYERRERGWETTPLTTSTNNKIIPQPPSPQPTMMPPLLYYSIIETLYYTL